MSDKSSYLRYLPPVLWEKEPPPPKFSLGAMLRIFEKILTGLDDNVTIGDRDGEYEPVEAVIARLHKLFNPWTTPPEFLDWLAEWVSLEFPEIWDEYQRRKVTSEIVQIYQRRGLKAGLNQYLDLYTIAEKRPRIAIDDNSKILVTRPEVDRFAPIDTLISQQPLISPLCLTLAPDRSLFVGDAGTPGGWSPVENEEIWRLPLPGRYEFSGAPPQPQLFEPPGGWNLQYPIAIATDDGTPWHLYVLDRVVPPGLVTLYQLTAPGFNLTATITKASLNTIWPVAMAIDTTNGHLLILDRGQTVPSGAAATPKIIDVQADLTSPIETSLTEVLEPLSLLVLGDGDLIIGDGREQNAAVPADLVRVDRTNPTSWVESRLLSSLGTQNPLVMPTALVRDDSDRLFVLDVGLKPYLTNLDPALSGEHFRRHIAEPATIYQVDTEYDLNLMSLTTADDLPTEGKLLVIVAKISNYYHARIFDGKGNKVIDKGKDEFKPDQLLIQQLEAALGSQPIDRQTKDELLQKISSSLGHTLQPLVTRVTENHQLVYPTGMVWDEGTLYICDRGEYSDPSLSGAIQRVWRAVAHEFGVIVHFSEQRPTTQLERRQIVQNIREIVDQEKPAHTAWTMTYSV